MLIRVVGSPKPQDLPVIAVVLHWGQFGRVECVPYFVILEDGIAIQEKMRKCEVVDDISYPMKYHQDIFGYDRASGLILDCIDTESMWSAALEGDPSTIRKIADYLDYVGTGQGR